MNYGAHGSRAFLYGVWLVLSIAGVGCGGRVAKRFTPTPDVARRSVDAALQAWQQGEPPGAIVARTPTVQVVDTTRVPGQTLRDFQVLSETGTTDAARGYVVRLALDNPAAQQRARYVVIGIDPVWVFRKEDYDRLAHWEHPMTAEDSPSQTDPALAPSNSQ